VPVNHHPYRIALLGAAAATLAAPAVHAQQATPSPTPVPVPRSTTIFSPALGNFSLRPAGEQSQPQPQPTLPVRITAPTPAPTPAPSPTARATPPAARPTPQPAQRTTAPAPTPAVRATPTPSPAPQASNTPTAVALPTPEAATPAAVEAPAPVPAQPPAGGVPWLWILLGAFAAALVGAGGWLLGRRGRPAPEPEPEAPVAERQPPRPAHPAPAPAPTPVAPPRPALAAAPAEPIAIEFHPLHIDIGEKSAVLEFELGLFNASGASADGLRVSLLLASANPDQDALIASFHASSALPAAGPPLDMPAGEGGRIPGKLAIEAERIHVVQVGGRPMFVPIVLIDLRWRGGLSIRRHGATFMVGTAGQSGGQGGKLGPIWLDRGAQRQTGLAANRYLPQARPVAA
jgi:hypothetical protein